MKTHEIREKSVCPELEACWERLSEPGRGILAEGEPAGHRIYVDGSYLEGRIGFGAVVLDGGKVVAELHGPVEEDGLQGMRQVGGELRSVYEAVRWCQTNGVQEVSVFYDYEGIAKWATREWMARETATQAYAQFMQACPLTIHWHKVDGHSGDRWNDRADRLAKLGTKQHRDEPQDPLADLQSKASEFVSYLKERDIRALSQGLVNSQFVRIVFPGSPGYLDLYNTRNRPLSQPYLHAFADSAFEREVEGLWRTLLSGTDQTAPDQDHNLQEATYYYEVLLPYRDCAFDFVDLAVTLDRVHVQVRGETVNTEGLRYDFARLEAIYSELKESVE